MTNKLIPAHIPYKVRSTKSTAAKHNKILSWDRPFTRENRNHDGYSRFYLPPPLPIGRVKHL